MELAIVAIALETPDIDPSPLEDDDLDVSSVFHWSLDGIGADIFHVVNCDFGWFHGIVLLKVECGRI